MPTRTIQKALSPIQRFFELETAGGILLLAAAAVAWIWANVHPSSYQGAWSPYIGAGPLKLSVGHWINDGLMAIFFLVVGLELKREIVVGELSNIKVAMLPIFGAIGGMIGPIVVYLLVTGKTLAQPGWGIPMATDIAFALGVMKLLGGRVPPALLLLMMGLAVVDDLGAILVIAATLSKNISLMYLGAGFGVWFAMMLVARFWRKGLPIVWLMALGLWFCIYKSGVHATIAGVMAALVIPAFSEVEGQPSPLEIAEDRLHLWVAYLVMPLFALANSGLNLSAAGAAAFQSPILPGTILGLLIGKQIGICGFVWLGIKLGLTKLPEGVGMRHVYGLSWLAGIGFTMSLLIATLSFTNPTDLEAAKVGVALASLIAGLGGAAVFYILHFLPKKTV